MSLSKQLQELVVSWEKEQTAFEQKGNGAAGGRARKLLSEITSTAKALRKEIQDIKNSKKESKEA